MKESIKRIQDRIQEAALACGRNTDSIQLIAVSKTKPYERIQEAMANGLTVFGENYIQEAREKIDSLADHDLTWHFIGHLQTNKAKYAVRLFDLIHTVDSLKLARELNRQAEKIGKIQSILIQVNVGMESSKSGVAPDGLLDLVKAIPDLKNLSLKGLMTIPPLYNEPARVLPYFQKLRELRDQITAKNLPGIEMRELSMGMTGDFEAAIREGATLIRIGTAIFGERK